MRVDIEMRRLISRATGGTGAVLGAALLLGASLPAAAAPILPTFTWDPGGAVPSLAASNPFTADSIGLIDQALISINNGTGQFTESGVLKLNSYALLGNAVNPVGLNTSYAIYATFTATGSLSPIGPGVLLGAFTSLDYVMIGAVGNNGSITPGTLTLSGTFLTGSTAPTLSTTPLNRVALAHGSLVNGFSSIIFGASSPPSSA